MLAPSVSSLRPSGRCREFAAPGSGLRENTSRMYAGALAITLRLYGYASVGLWQSTRRKDPW
jgi:hypothetical protein